MTLGTIGSLTWPEIDSRCRQITLAMAQGVQKNAADGNDIEAISKTGYDGVADSDIVLPLDLKSQEIFLKFVLEKFPIELGLIAEENGLQRIPIFINGHTVTLTADPVDGTRVLARILRAGKLPTRGQVSVMLGILVDNHPVAAYICDVSDLTMYVRAPYSDQLLQVDVYGNETDMATLDLATPTTGMLLWHGSRPVIGPLAQHLTEVTFKGRIERHSHSIGLSAMNVLTGKYVGLLRSAGGFTTPWDNTPVGAMCEVKNGLVILEIMEDCFREVALGPLDRITPQDSNLLYIPRRCLSNLQSLASVFLLT